MRLVVVTGMSGAGKSQAIKIFEDMGYYCIDNMPPQLIMKFAEVCNNSDGNINKVAFAVDIRSGNMFKETLSCIDEYEKAYDKCEILFFDADNEILVKRYKETRRRHPLDDKGDVLDGINRERLLMTDLRRRASYIVNTSNMKPKQLGDYIKTVFSSESEKTENIAINIMSFGFKYGIPVDADLVFDVRFLPNPFYIPELKEKTGFDKEVSDYVMNSDISKEFLKKLCDMIDFLLPNYIEEGKSSLVVAIGCTGGKHRSVTMANELSAHLSGGGYNTFSNHRDINKDRLI